MRIGAANSAGCLVSAVKVDLVAPYPTIVSECLLLDTVSHTRP